ncbi:MAG TPA: hypothetical protein VH374_02435 [Polyangia bacterium]|jgi:hypothetical protein|nr:hypothetical protein [Polyangia bacterium]
MRKVSQWLAILFVTAVTGSAMAAATVETVKVKDQSLLASFSDNSNGACGAGTISSSVDVQWNSSLIKSDGTTMIQSAILVSVNYVNLCTGDELTMSGFIGGANGSVATDLASGHVDAVVPVMTMPDPDTGSFVSGTVKLSLNFTATGSATTIRNRSHSRDGGVITISNFTTSSRPAVATGTCTATLPLIGGPTTVDLLGGQQSFSAQIGKDANGNLTIITNAH